MSAADAVKQDTKTFKICLVAVAPAQDACIKKYSKKISCHTSFLFMTHSYRVLYYHCIWSTLERRPFITPAMHPQLYAYIAGIIKKHNGCLMEIGGTENHVHLLIQLKNPDEFSQCIREVKASSSVWVHQNFSDQQLFAWQEGYGVFSVSYSMLEKTRRYIQTQQQHHLTSSFEQEYLFFLHKHHVAYDKRFALG